MNKKEYLELEAEIKDIFIKVCNECDFKSAKNSWIQSFYSNYLGNSKHSFELNVGLSNSFAKIFLTERSDGIDFALRFHFEDNSIDSNFIKTVFDKLDKEIKENIIDDMENLKEKLLLLYIDHKKEEIAKIYEIFDQKQTFKLV